MAKNTDLYITADAWAEIVIKNWRRNMALQNISHKGSLLKSFAMNVAKQANGDPALIQFAFNYYGKFVDMGVGNGVTLADVPGENRKPKPWYSKEFFSQVKRLSEIFAEKYADKASLAIVENIDSDNKRWDKSWKKV